MFAKPSWNSTSFEQILTSRKGWKKTLKKLRNKKKMWQTFVNLISFVSIVSLLMELPLKSFRNVLDKSRETNMNCTVIALISVAFISNFCIENVIFIFKFFNKFPSIGHMSQAVQSFASIQTQIKSFSLNFLWLFGRKSWRRFFNKENLWSVHKWKT